MRLSLRARLIIGIVALMACGLAIADVVAVVSLRSYLLERLDQQVDRPFGRPGPGVPQSDPCTATADRGEGQQLPTDFVITIFDSAGAQRCQLPRNLQRAETPDLSGLGSAELAVAAEDQRVFGVPGRDGATAWRVRVNTLNAGYVVIAVSTTEVQATLRRVELVTASTSLVILALAATVGFVLVRVGLRPLTAIEDTAGAIARGDLSRRVAEAPPSTEVGRLAAALNGMLTQIEQAFTARAKSEYRLRRFVADASHELRTPLATIRGHAELYRQGVATSPDEVSSLLNRIESEAVRMGALVEDLLLLARMDVAPQLDKVAVDLLSIAATTVSDARVQDPTRPITLHPKTGPPWDDEPPVVIGDEARLHQVLANLISNALRHTAAGLPVEVEIGVRAGHVQIRVVDHGPGLAPEVADKVFERFYRGDAGRSRQSGGTGLGLAIVASIVQAHGGRIRYEPSVRGGSTFIVELAAQSQFTARAGID